MFNKSFLLNKIVDSLIRREFLVFLSQGCFDIAARKKFLLLIKTLINIDGLSQQQALSLRAISHFVSAYPLIVSIKTNRELLSDEMIYSRFQLPVITFKMFERVLENDAPDIRSAKGRHTISINIEILKQRRKELQLTLKKLSETIGISKKAMYEIESKRVNPSIGTVKKLETVLETDLKTNYRLELSRPVYLKPKDEFRSKISMEFNRIGIDNTSVYSAPFEIVGRESFSLITGLSTNTTKIKREASIVKRLSSVISSQAIFVAKKSEERIVEGVPVLLESELPEIDTVKELNELITEKRE